jgi:hypothetical protein
MDMLLLSEYGGNAPVAPSKYCRVIGRTNARGLHRPDRAAGAGQYRSASAIWLDEDVGRVLMRKGIRLILSK